ncbi:HET-domain-containing protein [Hypoxylon sp. FL1150]|nr:HET-domain-containing protein [Hypoxylon sp. FL1150]
MPKRVLNLHHDTVVLEEDAQPGPYACVSHCWGKSKRPTVALKSTSEEYKIGIPFRKLSKTFRDAVDISRRSDISYLWIDSPCIIQNSNEDWNEEAVKMGDIYAHAHFTIAATGADDSSGGCYRDRDPACVSFGTVAEGLVYVRKNVPSINDVSAHTRPLLTRAWTFQEMLLSTRVTHFTAEDVIWQCNECQRSESRENMKEYYKEPGRKLARG